MRDFLVIGAGSAGSVLAGELARRGAGSVMVLEAGPSDRHPLVSVPFGLVWLMGSARDWQFQSTPQAGANGRQIAIPRGRMVGGSGSINSMVWFRGQASDFDGWQQPGWDYAALQPAFDAVEAALRPVPMTGAHPLSRALAGIFAQTTPDPSVESAGLFAHNMIRGARNSAARAFLRSNHAVQVQTGAQVDRLLWNRDRAVGAVLVGGAEVRVSKGVILAAGSVASPAILMRSGIGPRADLKALGMDTRLDAPEVGANLHDHPGVGLFFHAPATGYGLEFRQWPQWGLAPLRYMLTGRGPFGSPTCEAGAFFNARGTGPHPDVQTHFIPFFMPHDGSSRYQRGSGYFADVCLCRPKSRGVFRITSKDPLAPPAIDLGLLQDDSDLDTLVAGLERLRALLAQADFGDRRAPEVFPGPEVTGTALRDMVRARVGTAYHPVGTLRLGGPVTPRLAVAGTRGLWVADASVMPQVTSANTNAPSMMIGWKGAEFITEDAA